MPHSPKPLTELTKEFFNRVPCGSWHLDPTSQRYFTQPHIPEFAEFWIWKNKKVLEIGCGIGTDTVEFVQSGAKVWAVDASKNSIEMAQKRCPRAFYMVANAEEFLPIGPFDLVYSFGVLHHTPHPEKVLQRAHDALVDVGELRIMLYAKWSWKHLFTRQQPEAQAGCPYVKWYSKREARKLVEDCGFHVRSFHGELRITSSIATRKRFPGMSCQRNCLIVWKQSSAIIF
jgi:SAM-dependent methyltransferase